MAWNHMPCFKQLPFLAMAMVTRSNGSSKHHKRKKCYFPGTWKKVKKAKLLHTWKQKETGQATCMIIKIKSPNWIATRWLLPSRAPLIGTTLAWEKLIRQSHFIINAPLFTGASQYAYTRRGLVWAWRGTMTWPANTTQMSDKIFYMFNIVWSSFDPLINNWHNLCLCSFFLVVLGLQNAGNGTRIDLNHGPPCTPSIEDALCHS